MNRDVISQKEEPLVVRGRSTVCIRHLKSEMPIIHPSVDVNRTKKSWLWENFRIISKYIIFIKPQDYTRSKGE